MAHLFAWHLGDELWARGYVFNTPQVLPKPSTRNKPQGFDATASAYPRRDTKMTHRHTCVRIPIRTGNMPRETHADLGHTRIGEPKAKSEIAPRISPEDGDHPQDLKAK